MNKENVLITGGAGFIGRAIVAKCLEQGHKVTVVDNLSAGRMENISAFLPEISFHQQDILNRSSLEAIFNQTKPGIIFHMAALHYIPYCNAHPDQTLRTNVEGTFNVLEKCVAHNARVAVIASSGAFYPSLDTPLNEETEALPVDVYGLSKLITEQTAKFHASTSSLKCVAARLFNTYGPYETNPHLIPVILESLSKGDDILLGNIHTKRDYIFVEDVAEILYRSAFIDHESFMAINVGTGDEHSAQDIVEMIGELLDRAIHIDIDSARIRLVDKQHQMADTRKLRLKTGLQAKHSLRKGLQKLLVHENFKLNKTNTGE